MVGVTLRPGLVGGCLLLSLLAAHCGGTSAPVTAGPGGDSGAVSDRGPGLDGVAVDVADAGSAGADGGADGGGAEGTDSGAASDARTADVSTVDLGGIPFDGAACGATRFDVGAVPPNVLILLDRSCSMRRTPMNGAATAASGTSKWSIAVAAIHGITATYPTQVRWGLIYLPRGGTMADGVSCAGSAVCGGTTTCPEVAPAPASGPRVDAILGGISPFVGCGTGAQVAITPIRQGLAGAGMVTQLHDAARSNYVMLITDGEETCVGMPALVSTVSALRTAGIRTAVVGFGAAGAGGVNPVELNAMATAGGVPSSGATQYYAANDAASLQSALTGIVGATIACTFTLRSPPADPSLLHVYVNAMTELPRDPRHATGWDFDPATRGVTLYGTACADLRALRDSQIDVIAACPGAVTPPPPPAMCHHDGQSCTSTADCCNLEGLSCDTSHGACIPTPS